MKKVIIVLMVLITIGVLGFKQARYLKSENLFVDFLVYKFAEPQFENAPEQLYNEKYTFDVMNTYMYPPITLNYFRLIKSNMIAWHMAICVLMLAALFGIWIRMFKADIKGVIMFLAIFTFGVFNGLDFFIRNANMTVIEMFFLWLGVAAIMKGKMKISMLCILLAGSIKLYLWVFGIIYLFMGDQSTRLKNMAVFCAMVAGYLLLNYALYPGPFVAWIKYMPAHMDTTAHRNPFHQFDSVFRVFWAGISLAAVWYWSKMRDKMELSDWLVLWVFAVINMLPRFAPYQFIYLIPVFYWMFSRIKDKYWAFLFMLPPFILLSWNYYYITAFCWLAMIYVFIDILPPAEFIKKNKWLQDLGKRLNKPKKSRVRAAAR
jgi:hypothetical protein